MRVLIILTDFFCLENNVLFFLRFLNDALSVTQIISRRFLVCFCCRNCQQIIYCSRLILFLVALCGDFIFSRPVRQKLQEEANQNVLCFLPALYFRSAVPRFVYSRVKSFLEPATSRSPCSQNNRPLERNTLVVLMLTEAYSMSPLRWLGMETQLSQYRDHIAVWTHG